MSDAQVKSPAQIQSKVVAETILNQLGGGRIKLFIGATLFTILENGLGIRFTARAKGGINHVEIRLNGKDTYDVKFFRIKKLTCVTVSEFEDVYNDQLVELFEKTTGLYLHF